MNDIFSKMDSMVDSKGGEELMTSLTSTLNKAKEEYASGEIDYTQFADKMGEIKNELVSKFHFTSEEASEVTNSELWKQAGSSEKAFATTMTDTANSVGLAGQKMQNAFQTQYGAFNGFLNEMGKNTELAKQKIQEDLQQLFVVNPDAGHTLEEKLGISMETSLQAVANAIGSNSQLQNDFAQAMGYVTTGQAIPDSLKNKLSTEIQNVISGATKNATTGEKGTIKLKTKIQPDGSAKSIGANDGLAYTSGFLSTGKTSGNIIGDSQAGSIGSADGSSYTSGFLSTGKATGNVLSDKNASGIGSQDGDKYSSGFSTTGKGKGNVLSDVASMLIGKGDGSNYASGVNATAKGKGNVLSDGNASGTGSRDGSSWKSGMQSTAIGKGRVVSNGSAYSIGASDGQHWYSGFLSVAENLGSELSHIVGRAKTSFSSSFFVLPNIKINTQPTISKISQAHRQITSHAMRLFSSNRVATGGVSATGKGSGGKGIGGKGSGGKGSSGISTNSAISFIASPPTSASSIDSTMSATGIGTENLISFLPSNQEFFEAGNSAGMSYASGVNQANNYVIQSEITQTERLQEIQNEYFNTSSNGLKLNIDLNQRLKNALTDVGNALQENQALQQQSTTNGNKTIDLLNQEINLLNQKKQLNENILSSDKEQLEDMKESLQKEGVSFDSNGNILNAVSRLQQLESWINNIPSSVKDTDKLSNYGNYNIPSSISSLTKQQAEQTIQNIQSMVQAYNQMLHNTIPETQQSITDTQNSINAVYNNMLQTASDVESQITQIIKKQIAERKQAIQDEAQTQVKALNTTLQNLQQEHEQQSYQTTLKQQYKQLQQIQEQINDAELDHSLNGQARVKQLKEEYQNQQDEINQTISNQQYQNAQDKIQKEIDSINNNAQKEEEDVDKEWTPQKIENTVKQAMETGSFKDVEGKIESVQQAWTEFANQFDNGLGIMGNKIKDDFIGKLQEVQKIMQNLQNINKALGYYKTTDATPSWVTPDTSSTSLFKITPSLTSTPTVKQNSQISNANAINFNAPIIEVKGSIGNTNELNNYAKNIETKVTDYIVKNLRNRGIM